MDAGRGRDAWSPHRRRGRSSSDVADGAWCRASPWAAWRRGRGARGAGARRLANSMLGRPRAPGARCSARARSPWGCGVTTDVADDGVVVVARRRGKSSTRTRSGVPCSRRGLDARGRGEVGVAASALGEGPRRRGCGCVGARARPTRRCGAGLLLDAEGSTPRRGARGLERGAWWSVGEGVELLLGLGARFYWGRRRRRLGMEQRAAAAMAFIVRCSRVRDAAAILGVRAHLGTRGAHPAAARAPRARVWLCRGAAAGLRRSRGALGLGLGGAQGVEPGRGSRPAALLGRGEALRAWALELAGLASEDGELGRLVTWVRKRRRKVEGSRASLGYSEGEGKRSRPTRRK